MHIKENIISSIMANENYGVCYEPIIKIDNMQIVAYEALSRFKNNSKRISPYDFFKSIHQDFELFFFVETILKKFQLKHRPKNKKLFLNIDPDVAIKQNHISYWMDFFDTTKDIIVEITENSDEDSADAVENFMDWMDEYNVVFAYDDYAQPNSMFFTSLLHRASYIKLDIDFIRTIRKNRPYIEVAKGISSYARLSNKYTILEGIESESDLEIAKEIGVDFIQGYLFKDKFIDVWS